MTLISIEQYSLANRFLYHSSTVPGGGLGCALLLGTLKKEVVPFYYTVSPHDVDRSADIISVTWEFILVNKATLAG